MSEQNFKLPPQNLEAEQSVLGGMLLQNDAINKVVELISSDDFYRDAHRKIYQAVIELYQKNEPADLVTVTNILKQNGVLEAVGGASYLSNLVDQVPSTANIASYAKIIREKAVVRKLIEGANEIAAKGFEDQKNVDEYLDQAEKIIFEIAQKRLHQGFSPLKEIVRDSFKAIEQLYEKKVN